MASDPKLSAVGSFRVGGETTLGEAASHMDAMRVASIDISGLERVALANEYTRQGDYETERILGGSKGTITTRHRLHGYSSSIPTTAPSWVSTVTENATGFDHLVAILGSLFGQLYAGGYAGTQTVGASGSPTDTLTSTDLSSFKSGQPICWATGVTRRAYEVGWITGIDTSGAPDEATLLQRPRRDPQGASLWGAYTAFVRDLQPFHSEGLTKSWTLRWLGHNTDDSYIMYGCQPIGCKITMAVNQVPIVEITWGVAHWSVPSDSAGPAVDSWSFPEPEAAIDWQVAIGAGFGGSAPIYPVTKEISFDLGLTRVALEGGHSDSGVEGWLATMRRPKLTLQALWDSDWFTAFDDQSAMPVTVQVGSQPGRIIALCLPAARLVSLPKRGDRDGITVMDLEFEAHYYEGDGGTDDVLTYPRDSLARIAFL